MQTITRVEHRQLSRRMSLRCIRNQFSVKTLFIFIDVSHMHPVPEALVQSPKGGNILDVVLLKSSLAIVLLIETGSCHLLSDAMNRLRV